LLNCTDALTRRAAVLSLGLIGTYDSNAAVAALLHDEDPLVQRFASDALWNSGSAAAQRTRTGAFSKPSARPT